MDRNYFPVLILLGFVVANAVMMLALSHFTLRAHPTPEKQVPYESGIPPLGDARERFSVKFYMVAMLFIVFDIETVFMIPWAAYYRQLSCAVELVAGACPADRVQFFGLGEMLVFMLILLVGYVYVWRKGALQWGRPPNRKPEARKPDCRAPFPSSRRAGTGGSRLAWTFS